MTRVSLLTDQFLSVSLVFVLIRMKEIEMGEFDAKQYAQLSAQVAQQVQALRVIIEALEVRSPNSSACWWVWYCGHLGHCNDKNAFTHTHKRPTNRKKVELLSLCMTRVCVSLLFKDQNSFEASIHFYNQSLTVGMRGQEYILLEKSKSVDLGERGVRWKRCLWYWPLSLTSLLCSCHWFFVLDVQVSICLTEQRQLKMTACQ